MSYALRGKAGRSVKIELVRSGQGEREAIIAVPITNSAADILRYRAHERKTRENAKFEAMDKYGLDIGYIHLRDMSGASAEDAFARNFFPNAGKVSEP